MGAAVEGAYGVFGGEWDETACGVVSGSSRSITYISGVVIGGGRNIFPVAGIFFRWGLVWPVRRREREGRECL